MVEELGFMPVDPNTNPAKRGAVTFVSFMAFGSIPLLVYIGLMNKNEVFLIATGAFSSTLFALGCLKAKLIQTRGWGIVKSGMETLGLGGVACGMSYIIGWGLEKYWM